MPINKMGKKAGACSWRPSPGKTFGNSAQDRWQGFVERLLGQPPDAPPAAGGIVKSCVPEEWHQATSCKTPREHFSSRLRLRHDATPRSNVIGWSAAGHGE